MEETPFLDNVEETPDLDKMLRRAFDRVDDEDVRLFYEYFEELKGHARKYLREKARAMPGESAVVNSALFSLLCDVVPQGIPLSDVDERGYPALWPLLLKYIERHCNKWNKWYRAKKRAAATVSLATGIEPPDPHAPPDEKAEVGDTLKALDAKLTRRQRRVINLMAKGRTLEEMAKKLRCTEALVSIEMNAIRELLETG